jgi:predicted lipopolysaccharide heptosyltransferase III
VRILLIQLKRIGDLILTVPAITALRGAFPEATIHVAISHACRDLGPAIPGVNHFLIADSWAYPHHWLSILTSHHDYCLDFTRTDRSAFLTFVSRAGKKITYEQKLRSKWRTVIYDQFIDSSVRNNHTVDHHLALLEPLGISNRAAELHLNVPAEAAGKAEEILRRADIQRPFVIFHPGSARAEKFWEAQRWAEVITHWQGQPVHCVLTSGDSKLEQTHIGEIKKRLREPILDLSGKIDLLTLTALMAKASLLVSVDSAPTHLATAMGTPQIVLYGPTNPFHWRPRATPALILHGKMDGPMRDFSPQLSRASMNEISTRAVIDAMESLLSAPAAAPFHEAAETSQT